MHRWRTRACLALLPFLLLGAATAEAQENTATLRGEVQDNLGQPLPGVPVSLTRQSPATPPRTVLTDLAGRYWFTFLSPAADYFIRIDYPGYASTEVGPIVLTLGRTTVQRISLQPAADLTERVEVTAVGRVADTGSTETSTSFNTEFIEDLPVIGRNYQDILTLTAGVTDTDGDGNPNVQGARETGLQYRLDGANITDPVSGTYGQNLNIDAIQEIEVVTGGAGAEYGRADGGFANIITKSGSNNFEGTIRLFWRGELLDGDGALENDDIYLLHAKPDRDLRDSSAYLTLGGPLVRDKLWYFVSLQNLDSELPYNLAGYQITQTTEGRALFGKLTWQVSLDHKLSLQYNDDPYRFEGTYLDLGVDPDSDATVERGGSTWQLRWTAFTSPMLLMETRLSHFESGVAVTPVSDDFHEIEVETIVMRNGSQVTTQAVMPERECSTDGKGDGFIAQCDPQFGDGKPTIYQVDTIRGTVFGPFPSKTDDTRIRDSIGTGLDYTYLGKRGEHGIKAGMEFALEKFEDEPLTNAVFVNQYKRCRFCVIGNRYTTVPFSKGVSGFRVMSVPVPSTLDQRVNSFNSSAYLQDAWKPVPNLSLQMGLRIDREDIDTSGFEPFDPREERRESIEIVEGLCADGLRVASSGGRSNATSVCADSNRSTGDPPVGAPLVYTFDTATPESLRQFDRNEDDIFDSGTDGPVWLDPYTVFQDRTTEGFEIDNLNLSPRFSLAWDPKGNGKTKLFTTWGRYYDRLFLDTVDDEMGPDVYNFVFFPDPATAQFVEDQVSLGASAPSVTQLDRNLKTPFTDVFTLGIEQGIAAEWSAKVTYTQRLAWDLLQDVDINHVECSDYPATYGIPMEEICLEYYDEQGNPHLSDDLFGKIDVFFSSPFQPPARRTGPNGIPDLYIVSPNFNQVLRLGNYNSSTYRSLTFELLRRLHRNWQAQFSYSYSRITGQAEEFASALGNDPSTTDDEEGPLDYDQRHRAVLLATAHLPRDVAVGTSIVYESGTPYSVIAQTVDEDSVENLTFRTIYPTGSRNDQRNNGFWGIDLKLEKRFTMGATAASASLAVKNILNDDDVTLGAFRTSSYTEVSLERGPTGLRRFGRFWEIGLTLSF